MLCKHALVYINSLGGGGSINIHADDSLENTSKQISTNEHYEIIS